MIDALDIDPDDDVEIVLEVEAAFGITISESDAAGCETVGDLFKVVCAHVPTVERSDHLPCPTAQAFTALCRAIRLRQRITTSGRTLALRASPVLTITPAGMPISQWKPA